MFEVQAASYELIVSSDPTPFRLSTKFRMIQRLYIIIIIMIIMQLNRAQNGFLSVTMVIR
jgi:hypothetical protein